MPFPLTGIRFVKSQNHNHEQMWKEEEYLKFVDGVVYLDKSTHAIPDAFEFVTLTWSIH
jgi:hypothetical protein